MQSNSALIWSWSANNLQTPCYLARCKFLCRNQGVFNWFLRSFYCCEVSGLLSHFSPMFLANVKWNDEWFPANIFHHHFNFLYYCASVPLPHNFCPHKLRSGLQLVGSKSFELFCPNMNPSHRKNLANKWLSYEGEGGGLGLIKTTWLLSYITITFLI